MAGVVGVWFAKFGREAAPAAEAEAEVVGRRHQGDGLLEGEAVETGQCGREAAPAAEAEAEVVGRRHQGDGLLEVEAVKTVQIQERRRRNSAVLANSEDTVCMLMDRFAPA
uniref:Uncharacterized protein n=1 Tax=Aegilops tauschii TaxID=37682 RepID=M8C6E0_AEGTA